jgi:hypothetical protein
VPQYTPTQERLLAVLADGLPHRREELMGCLNDDLAERVILQCHISLLRKKLRPVGQDILCEFAQRTYQYRHVRLLASAYDGRK